MVSTPAGLAPGELTVKLLYATELKDTSFLGNNMDPYAILKVSKTKYRSNTHFKGGTRPVWDQMFVFQLEGPETEMQIEVWDQDMGPDDSVGVGTVNLAPVRGLMQQQVQVELHRRVSRKKQGVVHMQMSFVPASSRGHNGKDPTGAHADAATRVTAAGPAPGRTSGEGGRPASGSGALQYAPSSGLLGVPSGAAAAAAAAAALHQPQLHQQYQPPPQQPQHQPQHPAHYGGSAYGSAYGAPPPAPGGGSYYGGGGGGDSYYGGVPAAGDSCYGGIPAAPPPASYPSQQYASPQPAAGLYQAASFQQPPTYAPLAPPGPYAQAASFHAGGGGGGQAYPYPPPAAAPQAPYGQAPTAPYPPQAAAGPYPPQPQYAQYGAPPPPSSAYPTVMPF